MGFAAPALGAIAGGGGILGGLFGGKKSKQEKALMDEQLKIARSQEARAQEQFGIAKGYLPKFENMLNNAFSQYGQAQGQYNQVNKYYTDILKGGEGALNALLGPQRSAVNRAYQSQYQNIAQRGPRGGGTNQQLANADAERQGRLIDIALSARPQAAQGVLQTGQLTADIGNAISGLGSQFGNMALGFSGQGNAGLSASSSSISNLLRAEQDASARRAGALGGVGEALGNIFLGVGKKRGWFS